MQKPEENIATQLEHFLDYYKRTKSPGYAVLVTGVWGTGKTFQVRQCLSENESWYVSLFGLPSATEIHHAILSKVDPKLELTRSVISKVGATSQIMGGIYAVGHVFSGIVNNILRRELKPCRVLVLDDMERTNLEMKDLLGVINEYVEHHHFRVVLIGDEREMPKQFKRVKEKIIGKTIRIEPQANDALEAFVSAEENGSALAFLRCHQDFISHLFSQSNVRSLRILRQVVQDVVRLRQILKDKHTEDSAAMAELLGIFVSMNIEVRSGYLSAKDIRNRTKTRLKFAVSFNQPEKEKRPPRLLVSERKYQPVNFQSDIISDGVLLDMLVSGRYIEQDIVKSLDESSHFLSAEDLPPWKVVIKFDTLDNMSVDSGIRRMLEQFNRREIHDIGEMLHVFSLMMLMANNGTLDRSVEEIGDSCVTYVDELLSKDLLAPLFPDDRVLNRLYETHDGHVYWVEEAYQVEFERVTGHLDSARTESLERRLPIWANDLLDLAANDGVELYEEICRSHGSERAYARIPVLKHIGPQAFVDAWINGRDEGLRHISWALDERYRDGHVTDPILQERPWAIEVCKLLFEDADKLGGYQGQRIRRIIPKSLNRWVEEEKGALKNDGGSSDG